MSSSPNIQRLVIDRLTLEAFEIMKETANEKPGANGGYYAWFQQVIARSEASGDQARGMAAVIVMQAYADELISTDHVFDQDRLESRVRLGIREMAQG
jgi:hypothetical protein